jgi:hypothetical protein
MKLGPTPGIPMRLCSSPGRIAAIARRVMSWATVKAGLPLAASFRHAAALTAVLTTRLYGRKQVFP